MKSFNFKTGFAILVGLGLVVALNAFTNVNEKRTTAYWQFDSGSSADIRDGYSYSLLTEAPEESPCESGNDLPCVLPVDASIDTQGELNTYLHNTTVFDDEQDITDAAMYKKVSD